VVDQDKAIADLAGRAVPMVKQRGTIIIVYKANYLVNYPFYKLSV
jgi:hypothetical protein